MTRAEIEVIEAAQAFAKAREERETYDWDEDEMTGKRKRHHLALGAARSCVFCLGYLDAERRTAAAVEALPFHWRPTVTA